MNVEGDVEAKDADRWASRGLREKLSPSISLSLSYMHTHHPWVQEELEVTRIRSLPQRVTDPSEVKYYIFSSCQCQLETVEMLCKLQGADKLWTIRA